MVSDDADLVRDRLEIMDLIHSYGHFADAGDMQAFIGLFAEDAVIDIGIPGVSDKAALRAAMQNRPAADAGAPSRHVMTNLVFHQQSADQAGGALYFTLMRTQGGRTLPAATGTYSFCVARRDGAWRIQQWRAAVDGAAGAEQTEGAARRKDDE